MKKLLAIMVAFAFVATANLGMCGDDHAKCSETHKCAEACKDKCQAKEGHKCADACKDKCAKKCAKKCEGKEKK